jgi:hypothetical protein
MDRHRKGPASSAGPFAVVVPDSTEFWMHFLYNRRAFMSLIRGAAATSSVSAQQPAMPVIGISQQQVAR